MSLINIDNSKSNDGIVTDIQLMCPNGAVYWKRETEFSRIATQVLTFAHRDSTAYDVRAVVSDIQMLLDNNVRDLYTIQTFLNAGYWKVTGIEAAVTFEIDRILNLTVKTMWQDNN